MGDNPLLRASEMIEEICRLTADAYDNSRRITQDEKLAIISCCANAQCALKDAALTYCVDESATKQ